MNAERSIHKKVLWKCRCDCGEIKIKTLKELKRAISSRYCNGAVIVTVELKMSWLVVILY
jgi:hypothetical protein